MESIRDDKYLATKFTIIRQAYYGREYPPEIKTYKAFFEYMKSLGYVKGMYMQKIVNHKGLTLDNIELTKDMPRRARKKKSKTKAEYKDKCREYIPRLLSQNGNTIISEKHYDELGKRYGIYKLCGKCHIYHCKTEKHDASDRDYYLIERITDE